MTTAEATLDGNAIGGLLLEVFGVELTAAMGTCASCGARGEVARWRVRPLPGIVGRCPLRRVLVRSSRRASALHGLRSLELPRSG